MPGEGAVALTPEERASLREALRSPRGRFDITRASQLSGVPTRTMYHWAKTGALVPDFDDEHPKTWSYRDLVYLRLTAWLRVHRIELEDVVRLVSEWRETLGAPGDRMPTKIHADGFGLSVGRMVEDQLRAQPVLETMIDLTQVFDLLEPVAEKTELRQARLWGPNLVRPSEQTSMSPWVMAGEPCLRNTRIPTANLYVLHERRRLRASDLAHLYPGTSPNAIEDGIGLEKRLRTAHAA